MLAEIQLEPQVTTAVAQPGLVRSRPAQRFTAAHGCVVVSVHADRREMLADAASGAGWEAVTCLEPTDGVFAVGDQAIQLCVIDLQDCNLVEQQQLRELAGRFVRRPNCLLVVCGNQGDPREELWARQLGVWLYLPGVEEHCDVTSLCAQAREVADRLDSRPHLVS
jgi:hypothetical protein